MPKGPSRLLVIDASVARAAGLGENPASSATRHFLELVLEICHRMAMTVPIREEWHRHQAKFTRRWRLAMYAKRKIETLQYDSDPNLAARLLRTRNRDEDKEAMLKDMPLIVAARQADHVVVSWDETARDLFRITELGSITWVNPVRDSERIERWLERGAPPVEEWKLGYRQD